MILDFELFCDTLTGGQLLYQLKKHSLCLFVQVGKITVQLAGDLQLCVQRLAVLPEIPQMSLSPDADGAVFFGRYGQARKIIVSVQLVSQSILFVVDLLFHCVTLPFIIIASMASPPPRGCPLHLRHWR